MSELGIIVCGACGRMGTTLLAMIDQTPGLALAAAVDRAGGSGIYTDLAHYTGPADVLIDFSTHTAAPGIVRYCTERGLPLVMATTGHDQAEQAAIEAAGQHIALFRSANMSMGVSLLAQLVSQVARALPGWDAEIVETHHNRKQDAPSGTALMLAQQIQENRSRSELVLGRSGHRRREPSEIGIHAVRMGNITGTHEVLFSSGTQTLTLRHEAHSPALFAEGALAAARFLAGKAPGLYTMAHLLSQGGPNQWEAEG